MITGKFRFCLVWQLTLALLVFAVLVFAGQATAGEEEAQKINEKYKTIKENVERDYTAKEAEAQARGDMKTLEVLRKTRKQILEKVEQDRQGELGKLQPRTEAKPTTEAKPQVETKPVDPAKKAEEELDQALNDLQKEVGNFYEECRRNIRKRVIKGNFQKGLIGLNNEDEKCDLEDIEDLRKILKERLKEPGGIDEIRTVTTGLKSIYRQWLAAKSRFGILSDEFEDKLDWGFKSLYDLMDFFEALKEAPQKPPQETPKEKPLEFKGLKPRIGFQYDLKGDGRTIIRPQAESPSPLKGVYISPILGAGFGYAKGTRFKLSTCLLGLNSFNVPGNVDPAVVGGVRVGLWFEQGGLLGTNIPSWLGYFGFYSDFTFQRQNFRDQILDSSCPFSTSQMFSHGVAATWTFKLAARYPFWRDQEHPEGRAWVYGGFGGGVYFASQNPSFQVKDNVSGVEENIEPGSQSSAVACLSADAGLKFFFTRHVYGDLWFNYTYAEPSFSYRWTDPHQPTIMNSFSLNPQFHNFGVRMGVGWQF